MFTKKQKGERTFVPITPRFPSRRDQKNWINIGAAIILISLIVAIILGAWSAMI